MKNTMGSNMQTPSRVIDNIISNNGGSGGIPRQSIRSSLKKEHRYNGSDAVSGPFRGNQYALHNYIPKFDDMDSDSEAELDIDELLGCENIENCAFLNTSKKLLSSIEGMITIIDDKLKYKKPAGYYFNYQNAGAQNR